MLDAVAFCKGVSLRREEGQPHDAGGSGSGDVVADQVLPQIDAESHERTDEERPEVVALCWVVAALEIMCRGHQGQKPRWASLSAWAVL
jgi:hypothetical protein